MTASTPGAPAGALSRAGVPRRCQPVADQWPTGTSRAVPLAGSGTRMTPSSGRGRSFSRIQQRNRLSVPALSAAREGSGWSSASGSPGGCAVVTGRAGPASMPAGVRGVAPGPDF